MHLKKRGTNSGCCAADRQLRIPRDICLRHVRRFLGEGAGGAVIGQNPP
jgi:hypothetical protein